MRRLLLACVVVVAWLLASGQAEAQTATATATPTPTRTATPTPTATPTATPTVTATRTPMPDIACGTGPGAGGARTSGVCGGLCGLGTDGVAQVCRWDHTAANTGCHCVDTTVDCDLGGIGQEMCSQGECDRPPTMRGGNCTRDGNICRCK